MRDPVLSLEAEASEPVQATIVGNAVAHLNMHGECFLAVYRDAAGAIFQLGLLPPDRVEVAGRGGLALYTVTLDDGRRVTAGPEDVIHVRGSLSTADSLRGLTPVSACREAQGLEATLAEHGGRFSRTAARRGAC